MKPCNVGAYLVVHLGKHFAVDTELAEPDRTQSGSMGLELEDSILCVGPDNNLKIPVLNKANVSMDLLGRVPIGTVTVLNDFEDTFAQENSSTQSLKISMVSPGNLTTQRQQRLESALTISPTLTSKQSAELMECVVNHHDVFALDDGEVGEVIGVEHKIHTGDSAPIRQLPRRVPFAVRGEITRMVQEMLKDGVIQESASPWASPVVLVKKKDGTLRFCVDYRRLNAVTHKDTFPLPRIDDLLDQMQGKKVFSTLDAKRGYWQIKVQEESKEKTAFVTFEGLYEFRVMPFGLCNAPSTFQRLMQRILQGLGSFCSVYIDDILIFSESVEEHLVHLSQIFRRIESFGLKLHPKKSSLGHAEVLFHVVSAKGIHPDPAKIRAVKEFPVPTNVRLLRGFLGLASYYRRFVPNFARIAGPLHMLTRSDMAFVWTASCQEAFERLKSMLTSPPVLSYPDFSEPFQLHTDASGEGLGAVLEQTSDGVGHPVAFASRTLSKPEQRYGITELETLGVV